MVVEREIVLPLTREEAWEALTEPEHLEERLVLRWDDEGRVELELSEHPAGTRVHVRETAPEWGVALELHASAAWAKATA